MRYRNLLVRQAVQMKNKIAVLLMEAGVSYSNPEVILGRDLPGGKLPTPGKSCKLNRSLQHHLNS